MRSPFPVRKSSLGAALALAAIAYASVVNVGCGSDEVGREPEQADAAADNPAAAIDVRDPGLGDKSPGQPSPWEHIDEPVKTQSTAAPTK